MTARPRINLPTRRLYALVLAIWIIPLVVGPAIALDSNLLPSPSAAGTDATIAHYDRSGLTATLLLNNFDLQNRNLTGYFRVIAPSELGFELYDGVSHQEMYDCGINQGFCAPRSDEKNTFFLFDLTFKSGGFLNRALRVAVPFTRILSDYFPNSVSWYPKTGLPTFQDVRQFTSPVSIPMVGDPRTFPGDSYSVQAKFSLEQNFVELGRRSKVKGDSILSIPGSPVVTGRTSLLGPYRPVPVHYFYDASGLSNSGVLLPKPLASEIPAGRQSSDLRLTLSRPASFSWFVYAVAAIPLAMVMLFAHFLFFNRHAEAPAFHEAVAPLLGAVLAVLPLHLILVPSDVSGLTRVDVLLGAGASLLISVALARYVTELWPAVGVEMPEDMATASAAANASAEDEEPPRQPDDTVTPAESPVERAPVMEGQPAIEGQPAG